MADEVVFPLTELANLVKSHNQQQMELARLKMEQESVASLQKQVAELTERLRQSEERGK